MNDLRVLIKTIENFVYVTDIIIVYKIAYKSQNQNMLYFDSMNKQVWNA